MTEYEAIKLLKKYNNEERVNRNINHLQKVKKKLNQKNVKYDEHLTHVNIKTDQGTIVYYQTSTVLLNGKKINKTKFWDIINKITIDN